MPPGRTPGCTAPPGATIRDATAVRSVPQGHPPRLPGEHPSVDSQRAGYTVPSKRVIPTISRLIHFAHYDALSRLVDLGACAVAGPCSEHPPLQAGDIIITGGQLFDGLRDTLVPNTGIVVRKGILLDVGANLTGRDTSAARLVTLKPTSTVLPGFFDLHAHYAIDLFGEGRVDEYTSTRSSSWPTASHPRFRAARSTRKG